MLCHGPDAMTDTRDSHCHACGSPYTETAKYPRTCPRCGNQLWANPIPVSVVLVPVLHALGTGLLVVRRGIAPQIGKLALVGGFLEAHETWQQGGAREIREETAVEIDAASLATFWFASTRPRPDRVLLFSTAAPVRAADLAPFVANTETLERGLVFGPDGLAEVFAFDLHTEAARRWFAAQGITGGHRHVAV